VAIDRSLLSERAGHLSEADLALVLSGVAVALNREDP
jgi:hypothetical protein